MDRKTQFIFRLKCIIKKCRENGLFNIAIKLKEKYDKRNAQRNTWGLEQLEVWHHWNE